MKHILMIASEMDKGGAERQIATFLKYYDRNKIKVTLALYYPKIEYEIPRDVELISLNKKYKFDFLVLLKLVTLIFNKKYQVINSKGSGVNEMVMFIAGMLRRKNIVIEIRTSGSFLDSYLKKMNLMFKIFNTSFWKIICNSKKAAKEINDKMKIKVKLIFIGNGIDTDKFSPQQVQKLNSQFSIAFVGRIDKFKNLEVLISAFKMLYDSVGTKASLSWMGIKTKESYFDDLMSVIQKEGFMDSFQYLGNQDDIENHYNKFDVIVLPSLFEGTPNTLLEAMSCGCVCLVSKDANSDSFLGEEHIFETQNAVHLFQKLLEVSQLSIEERAMIGKRNREFVLAHYSVKQMVHQYETIFCNPY